MSEEERAEFQKKRQEHAQAMSQWRQNEISPEKYEELKALFDEAGIHIHTVKFSPANWSDAEIDRLLGEDSRLFKDAYDVQPGGNWEGKTILNRSARPEPADAETEARLAACREILLTARA